MISFRKKPIPNQYNLESLPMPVWLWLDKMISCLSFAKPLNEKIIFLYSRTIKLLIYIYDVEYYQYDTET